MTTIETTGKARKPASYKQLEYLRSFENVTIEFRSGTQFMKHVNSWEASEAIDAAKRGEEVVIR